MIQTTENFWGENFFWDERYQFYVGLGGLWVTCDPSFAGSNPAEVDGFF